MPTYDYVCSACGHRMEVVHGIHAPGPERCPVCGGPMRKALNVPAVHFKGSGWAKKDRKAAASTKAAAKAGAGGDAGTDKSTDSTRGSGSDGGSDPGAKHDSSAKNESGAKRESSDRSDSGKGERSAPAGEPSSRAGNDSERTARTPSDGVD